MKEVVVTTFDAATDLTVRLKAFDLEFTMRPHDAGAPSSLTLYFTKASEAIAALYAKGYPYAEAFVRDAVESLKSESFA